MSKIISFIGPQGSGKTTLIKSVAKSLSNHGYKVITKRPGVKESIARDASNLGFKINQETRFTSQYYIALQYARIDMEMLVSKKYQSADFILLDRNIIDSEVYCAISKASAEEKHLVLKMIALHFKIHPTEFIYVPRHFGKLKDSKYRDTSDGYLTAVTREFVQTIHSEAYCDYYLGIAKPADVKTRTKYVTEMILRKYGTATA